MIDDNDEKVLEVNQYCYDEIAGTYDDGAIDFDALMKSDNGGGWKYYLEQLPGRRILDVGCGTGEMTRWFVDNGFEVVAIDQSAKMLTKMLEKSPTVRTKQLGATELEELAPEQYDGIVATHLIQHFNRSLLREFARQACERLSNEGKLLITFTNDSFPESGYQLEITRDDGLHICWFKWQIGEVLEILKEAGLRVLYQHNQTKSESMEEPFILVCEKAH